MANNVRGFAGVNPFNPLIPVLLMTRKLNIHGANSLATTIGGLAPILTKTLAIGKIIVLISLSVNKIKMRFLVRFGRSTLAFLI